MENKENGGMQENWWKSMKNEKNVWNKWEVRKFVEIERNVRKSMESEEIDWKVK